MESSNVLKQYLSLFDSDCNQFKTFMASNAVVDWFGRTIRGHTKIHDYLRDEVSAEYQHMNFNETKSCNPIEYKPTHIKTKRLPSGDIDYVLPKNKVSGITSLKLYADSDVEDDDVDMLPLTPEKTINATVALNSSAIITPPASTTKIEQAGSETESDIEDMNSSVATSTKKRLLKRTHPSPFSYLRRCQPTAMKRKLVSDAGIRALLLDESTDDEEELEKTVKPEYSALKYFEVTGLLRANKQTKHQGVGGTRTSTVATLPSAASHFSNGTSAGSWDRPIRMRFSYRCRLQDQQIQYALIIYEHLDKSTATETLSTRRNLMLEFSQLPADDDDDNEQTDEDIEVIVEQQHDTLLESAFLNSSSETAGDAAGMPAMTTPTKLSNTPPATPKRRGRLPQSLSSLKRYNAQHLTTALSSPSPKRSAARNLRL